MKPRITIGRAHLLRAEGDTDERRFTRRRREEPADDAVDQQISISISEDGDARIEWPEPARPRLPRRAVVLPAEVAAKLLLDPEALRANGVIVIHS